MNNIKIVVSDLDGTLVLSDMTISPENCEAIKKLAERGIHFAVSTGRTYGIIPKCVTENEYIRYISTANGTTVYDKALGKNIIENYVENADKISALNIIDDYDVLMCIHASGESYYEESKLNSEVYKKYHVNASFQKVFSNMPTTPDVRDLAENIDTVESIILFFAFDGELSRCKSRLEKLSGIKVTSSIEHNIEICSAKAGKENGLLNLLRILKLSPDECLALGDSTNDVGMFLVSGHSICTANGNEEAKAAAKIVGPKNDEHIVKFVYENLI